MIEIVSSAGNVILFVFDLDFIILFIIYDYYYV